MKISRRTVLTSGAGLPFAFDKTANAATPSEPPYTLSINIEIMFPRTMPRAQRMQVVADQGFKAYGFWNATDAEQEAMLKVQQATGLKCSGITGPGSLVSGAGLTKTGGQQAYLDEMTARAKMGQKFGGASSIIFVGKVQPDIPWETQRAQIVSGLKLCGEIAKEHGMTFI